MHMMVHKVAAGVPVTPKKSPFAAYHEFEEDLSWREVFAAYCDICHDSTDSKSMGGSTFARLCKECGFLDDAFPEKEINVVFAEVATAGHGLSHGHIRLAQFETAMEWIAAKRGIAVVKLQALLEGHGAPKHSQPVAAPVASPNHHQEKRKTSASAIPEQKRLSASEVRSPVRRKSV
eukprot:gnl/TRDRNA2_/TRDRNA2_165152_c1_seq1.p1 gnl/TRDRNA2_/TRDRNA2_165152_c1~~gnl/TRDRNA2_/TRDRNA2_165152_c1_seq1.p1  ORF type:complete len:177 (+),score=40.41 gnl/TRDRNA2_/TRDRNA2_165152_c1_seq1:105-635(+)